MVHLLLRSTAGTLPNRFCLSLFPAQNMQLKSRRLQNRIAGDFVIPLSAQCLQPVCSSSLKLLHMKKNIGLFIILVLLVSFAHAQPAVYGAWHKKEGDIEKIICVLPGYFSYAEFDKAAKKFVKAWGGICEAGNENLTITIEYNTLEKNTGSQKKIAYKPGKDQLATNVDGINGQWKKLDDAAAGLAGVWRITARESNGVMSPMQRTARKTIKIMSGTRFQWVAINTGTGEFFGTGGGTYTFNNGVYTEHIEFFPRDNSRVGASLEFKGKVTGNQWDHSGLSSKGEPIHETWTKESY